MVDEAEARIIAMDAFHGMDPGPMRELEVGWYFATPRMPPGQVIVGCGGVIVNKQTGARYRLGCMMPLDTTLSLYSLGFQAPSYDLTITRVADRPATVQVLAGCRLRVIEESFEHGRRWRIPRAMREDEIDARIATLPCTFPSVPTCHCAQQLHRARFHGVFAFTLSNPGGSD